MVIVKDAEGPEAAAARRDRIDILKQVVAFTEGNIRAYDTKAQISLTAFVLSAMPLVSMAQTTCTQGGAKQLVMVLFPAYILGILAFLGVLWPVHPEAAHLTRGLPLQDVFFVRNPKTLTGPAYLDRLQAMDVEAELAAEVLKLAHIRRVKALRFRLALAVALLVYLVVSASFFVIGRCFAAA